MPWSKSNSWIHIIFKINYLHAIAHIQFDFLLVHTLQVSIDVHFLFRLVHTKRTRELWLFAALPFLMVAQRRFQFIESTAFGTRIALSIFRFAIGWFAAIDARVFLLLLRFLMWLWCVQIIIVIVLNIYMYIYRRVAVWAKQHRSKKQTKIKREEKCIQLVFEHISNGVGAPNTAIEVLRKKLDR